MIVHYFSHMSEGLIGSEEDVFTLKKGYRLKGQLSRSFTVVTPPSSCHFDRTKFACFTLPLTQFLQKLEFCLLISLASPHCDCILIYFKF